MIKPLDVVPSKVPSLRARRARHAPRVLAWIPCAALLVWSPAARALQPLDDFVRGARTQSPANREAVANRAGAEARADEALGGALPGLSAAATYARNQWEVSVGGRAILPRDQFDATVTLAVPLVDLAKFARISAANRSAEAAANRQEATARETEAQVVQLYYQLAANLALVQVARNALEVVRVNLRLTEEASRAGTVTALDVQRARVEVERQSQQLTSAELDVKLAARALASQTGVVADTSGVPPLDDDLHGEPALQGFAAGVPTTPAVRAAISDRAAAERGATAQHLALVPTLEGRVSERYTNAVGFLDGHHEAYAAVLSLVWAFDFTTIPAIRSRNADAAAARAREDQTRLLVGDAIFRAWSTIDADIARSRSARTQAAVSARAAEVARTRYRSGVGTQLELIQADRDAYAAEAGRIQSDADLLNARRQLRLIAGDAASP
ncbi:MAG TPA: TolC family protein [Polyangia bacterium]|nr:TolC family protein [Polyangia bacterium]